MRPPPLPPPEPRDVSQFMIDNRLPNLTLLFQSASPVYGLLGSPFGLKLAGLGVYPAKLPDAAYRISLYYSNGLQSAELRHPFDSSSADSVKIDWSERYEFAFRNNLYNEAVSSAVSLPHVDSLWSWSSTEWLAKVHLDGNILFLGSIGFGRTALEALIESVSRLDTHSDSVAEQQSELWARMEEL
jgi:hypothetical protein